MAGRGHTHGPGAEHVTPGEHAGGETDLNRADKRDLVRLPGIGDSLADRIIAGRPFEDLADLTRVSGASEKLVDKLRKGGAIVHPPGHVALRPVKLGITLDAPAKLPDGVTLVTHVYDADGALVATGPADARALDLPAHLEGEVVTVAVVPLQEGRQAPTLARLVRGDLDATRVQVIDGRLDVGKVIIPPRFVKMSCCRVRGRVLTRVNLGSGRVVERPLCDARLVICEVDVKPIDVVTKLPDDLIVRLWDDLVLRERIPIPIPDPGPLRVHEATPDRFVPAAAAHEHHALAHFDTAATTATFRGVELATADLRQPVGGHPVVAADLREALLLNIDVVTRHWCRVGWLHSRYQVDCIKTVPLDSQGRFDTDISYPCHGDKPDLYFKVEQRCHTGEWETVHEPNVGCTTRWDYCCGDEIEILVSSAHAGLSTLLRPVVFAGGASDPAVGGRWDLLPYDSQVFPVHGALLRDGKVVMFSGGVESKSYPLQSRVWDPVTGAFTAQTFSEDLFCAFQNVLADGRVLAMGGTFFDGGSSGIKATLTFDPISKTWTKHADMKWGRWYPTSVTMPDESVLVFSGRKQKGVGGGDADEVERFNPATNTWTTLPASAKKMMSIYPGLHLMPDGRIFYTGTRWHGNADPWNPPDTALFDPATNTWADVGPHVIKNRTEAMSIQLPPRYDGHAHAAPGEEVPPPSTISRVLVLGGIGGSAADRASAEVIDLADAVPTWQRIADMHHRRVNPNAVILPDGNVLVCAGIAGHKWDGDPGYALESELFNPHSLTWSRAATMQIGRQYHSISILLPDGRVLNAGSVGGSAGRTDRKDMEIYSPPYLFRGPRPRVTAAPVHVAHGTQVRLTTPDACRIRSLVLLRPGAPTHHTDADQRYVPLAFGREGSCELTVAIPGDRNLLPPAWYLLFALDDADVPSVGRFINVR